MKIHISKISIICLLVALCAVTTAFAWFSANKNGFGDDLSGSALTGYFHDGDGSEENPYQLTKPIHVYNLAWLQYMGKLNYNEVNGALQTKQLYFELKNDINMDGYVLPPIGTVANPFIGHFDGKGYCISDLTVSNYLQDDSVEEGIINRPLSETTITENVSIVGFFGVVGDLEGKITGLADDSKESDVTKKVNAVHDLFLDNITVRTETEESLIGLFAGYVNGSASNIGVGTSSIVVGDDVLPLSKVVSLDMDKIISTYALVGKYNSDKVSWSDEPGGSSWNDDNNGGSGWGDSINIAQLRQRIYYIAGAVGLETSYYLVNNKFGYNGFIKGGSQKNIIEGSYVNTNYYPAFIAGSVMPLTLDTDEIDFSKVVNGITLSNGETLDTLEYYKNNTSTNREPVASMNTGYIVGGGKRTISYNQHYIEIRNDYVSGGYYYGKDAYSLGISKSINTSLDTTITFPANNLHLLTNVPTSDVNGKTYVISDDYNGNSVTWLSQKTVDPYEFVRFDDARLGFKNYQIGTVGNDKGVRNKFVESSKGSTVIQGILFNPKIKIVQNPSGADDISSMETTDATDVTILGEKYDSYSMIQGAINFSLLSSGRVTTIAATYSTYQKNIDSAGTLNHSLFRIFEVKRDPNTQKITSCEIINKVYEVLDPAAGEAPYAYNLVDPDSTKYKLVFDYNSMGTLKEAGAAYYFEIPLNAGDYAIGSIAADSGKKGAYLLYLDIGASGDMSVAPSPSGGKTHTMSDIKFVESSYIQNTLAENRTTNGYSVIAYEIKLADKTVNSTGLQISFTPSQQSVSYTATAMLPPNPASDFVITQKKKE